MYFCRPNLLCHVVHWDFNKPTFHPAVFFQSVQQSMSHWFGLFHACLSVLHFFPSIYTEGHVVDTPLEPCKINIVLLLYSSGSVCLICQQYSVQQSYTVDILLNPLPPPAHNILSVTLVYIDKLCLYFGCKTFPKKSFFKRVLKWDGYRSLCSHQRGRSRS